MRLVIPDWQTLGTFGNLFIDEYPNDHCDSPDDLADHMPDEEPREADATDTLLWAVARLSQDETPLQ
jgi:hypothetical protein